MRIPKEVAQKVAVVSSDKSKVCGLCITGPTRLYYKGRKWNVRKCRWIAWVGPLPDGCSVLPKCGNPECIFRDHLALTRPGCNFLDGQGYHRGNRSLDDKVAQEVRKMRNLGEQLKDIAAKIDRSVNTVWSIVHGKHYK